VVDAPPASGDSAFNSVEVEWQFDALDLRPVERWLANLPVTPHTAGLPTITVLAKPARRLTDHYLDTEDWRVARAGYVVRVRHHGRHDEATLKDTRPADPTGLRRRLEVTEPLPGPDIEGLGPTGPVGRRVHALAGRRPLRTVVQVRTRRRPFSLRVEGVEVAEVALDETAITVADGQRPARLRRVEVELAEEKADELRPIVETLRHSCGLQPASLSKFEMGLLTHGVVIPGPPDLGPTSVGPDATLAELAYAVVRKQILVMLEKEPVTRLGEDVEELHDMRVATRRLRAAFDLFADVLSSRAQTLRVELAWLAERLGAVRDLDVQIERMADMARWTATWAGDDPNPLDELRRLLVSDRDAARQELLDALDCTRWDRLSTGLVSLARQPPLRQPQTARLSAVAAVPDRVEQRHRAVMKAARRAQRSGEARDFHRLRIRCKRLRYSLEFTADIYEGRAEHFTRRLAKLQDSLGLVQDAEVATARLLALATQRGGRLSPLTVFAMGGVAERYRAEATDRLRRLPRHLHLLRGKEWKAIVDEMEDRRPAEVAPVIPAPIPLRPAAVIDRAAAGNHPANGEGQSAPPGDAPDQDPAAAEHSVVAGAWPESAWGPPIGAHSAEPTGSLDPHRSPPPVGQRNGRVEPVPPRGGQAPPAAQHD